MRQGIEWALLAAAVASLLTLAYLHVAFIRSPITCLQAVEWPRDGVLRIEVRAPATILHQQQQPPLPPEHVADSLVSGGGVGGGNGSSLALLLLQRQEQRDQVPPPQVVLDPTVHVTGSESGVGTTHEWPSDSYVVEYSLEYGFLRLAPKTRQRLGIPVKVVALDPARDACFGDGFSRFLLRSFLGYDDVLMGSLKALAEKQNNKGFVRNVVTGEHYRFVNIWSVLPLSSSLPRLTPTLSQDDSLRLRGCPLCHAGLHAQHLDAPSLLAPPGLCLCRSVALPSPPAHAHLT